MKKTLLTLLLLLPVFASAQTTGQFIPFLRWTNATGTSATTTNFATGKLCLTADTCRTTWPSAGSFAWPFTKLSTGEQATTTTLGLFNGFLSLASSTNLALFTTSNLLSTGSSTLQSFTALNSTSTNATSTNFYVSGTLSAANVYDTGLTGATCVGESNGLIGTANCVSSVSSSGNTLTVSPTTGAVDISLKLNHANDWTALQTFTNATSTLFSSQYASTTILCVSGDCRTAWPTGTVTSVSGAYPILSTGGATPSLSLSFGTTTANSWSLLNNFNMSSTTVASFGNAYFGKTATSSFDGTGALTVIASTTLQNFTASNATTSQATTTSLAVSGLSSNGFVKTYGGTGNFTIDTNTYLTSAVTAVTATYPILATTGNTPALSFAFGTTTANSWSLLNQFNLASTSVFSAGFASFGRTSTTTINGTGDLFVVSSTTLQNFTATNATTSQATTTNFAVTQSATLSKIPYIGPSGNIQALGIGTNLTLTNGTLSASGGSGGLSTTTMATTTSTVTGNAIAYLLNDTDILSIGAKATTTAKFWIDPNVLNPTYLLTLGTTTSGGVAGAGVLFGVTPNGHFSATSTRPGISGCGSGATITGTDAFGMVTPGTSQPGICLVTFNKAYANAPVCQVTGAGYSGGGKIWLTFNATTSSTLLTITSVATATGATTLNVPFPSYRVAYDCKEVLP